MMKPAIFQSRSRRWRAAFTLIEILITMGLLSFIVLGLLMMFNQVSRAFRSTMTQSSVLETGRNVTDLIARDMEQIMASNGAYETNFLAEINLNGTTVQGLAGTTTPSGAQVLRTNLIQRLFFLGRENIQWTGLGYIVDPMGAGGNGTLYRFATNRPYAQGTNLLGAFLNAPLDQYSRIADGIVHLRVQAFAQNGFPIYWDSAFSNAAAFRADALAPSTSVKVVGAAATMPNANYPGYYQGIYFWSNALPAYVELEVGIVEPQIMDRFKAIGPNNNIAQLNYLSNHIGQVHLFRQRIPIRNVDPNAYP